jgi:hypothetical protein
MQALGPTILAINHRWITARDYDYQRVKPNRLPPSNVKSNMCAALLNRPLHEIIMLCQVTATPLLYNELGIITNSPPSQCTNLQNVIAESVRSSYYKKGKVAPVCNYAMKSYGGVDV